MSMKTLRQCFQKAAHSGHQLLKRTHENSFLIGILVFLASFAIGILFYCFVNNWDFYLSYYYASTVLLGTLYLVPVDNNPYSQVFTLLYFLWGMVLMASALAVSAQAVLERAVKIASDERKRVLEQARLMKEKEQWRQERLRKRYKKPPHINAHNHHLDQEICDKPEDRYSKPHKRRSIHYGYDGIESQWPVRWISWSPCFNFNYFDGPIGESSVEMSQLHHRRSSISMHNYLQPEPASHQFNYQSHEAIQTVQTEVDSEISAASDIDEIEEDDRYCEYFAYCCGEMSVGEILFYYLDRVLVRIGWEYHRTKYLALTLLLFWFSVGVIFGICYEDWSFSHSFYFAASAITAAGVAPPTCEGESLDDCNLGPTRSLLIGTYLIIGVPLFGFSLAQFAEYLLEQVVRAKELKLMMTPISKSEFNYVLKLKQGVIPDQTVDDFDDSTITATTSISAKVHTASRQRGLSRQSNSSLSNIDKEQKFQKPSGVVLEFSDFLVLELLRLRKISKTDLEYIKSVYDVLMTQYSVVPAASSDLSGINEVHENGTNVGISLTTVSSPTTSSVRQPGSRRNSIVYQQSTYGALDPILEEGLDLDLDGHHSSDNYSIKIPSSDPLSLSRSKSKSIKADNRSRSLSGANGTKLSMNSEKINSDRVEHRDRAVSNDPLMMNKLFSTSELRMDQLDSFSPPCNILGTIDPDGNDPDHVPQRIDPEAEQDITSIISEAEYPSVKSSLSILANLPANTKSDLVLEYNRLLLPAMQQLQVQSQMLWKTYPSSSSIANFADTNETEQLLAARRRSTAYERGLSKNGFASLPFNEQSDDDESITNDGSNDEGNDKYECEGGNSIKMKDIETGCYQDNTNPHRLTTLQRSKATEYNLL